METKTINVSVHLKEQSQPILYENVINSYEKGSFFCVYTKDDTVFKHPIDSIWRIKEDYGYHGR